MWEEHKWVDQTFLSDKSDVNGKLILGSFNEHIMISAKVK